MEVLALGIKSWLLVVENRKEGVSNGISSFSYRCSRSSINLHFLYILSQKSLQRIAVSYEIPYLSDHFLISFSDEFCPHQTCQTQPALSLPSTSLVTVNSSCIFDVSSSFIMQRYNIIIIVPKNYAIILIGISFLVQYHHSKVD